MNRISVFCGSSLGAEEVYKEQAQLLGKTLAKQNIALVYGGANVGLMGAVANGALEEKGEVIGILPRFLHSRELAHKGLSELILVDTMHERKTIMNDLCNGVIALPGGIGTIEELFEMLTWAKLDLHKKPIGILNVNGFYDSLLEFMSVIIKKGFLKEGREKLLLVSDNIENLLNQMKEFEASIRN